MGVAERTLKVVVVGDAFVGKTSLLFAYAQNRFGDDYATTTLDNWAVTVYVNQKRCTVNLFDTAGQEDLMSLRALCYPNTDCFLVCFSLTDRNSLENVRTLWVPEIRRFVGGNVPMILVGTKEDLVENCSQPVHLPLGNAVAVEIGAVQLITCSALTHRGMKQVFDTAILIALNGAEQFQSLRQDEKKCCKCCPIM